MKNPFDPVNNLDEWIQNDWESDDYIENQAGQSVPEEETWQESDESPGSAWAWILAVIITVIKSPLFWIVIVVLALIKGC